MRVFKAAAFVLNFVVLTISGHSLHGSGRGHGHDHEEAISYTLVTKQDQLPDLPAGHEDYQGYPDIMAHHKQQAVNSYQEEYGIKGHDDYQGPVKFQFSYGVKDTKTGDIKNHWETRNGDSVKGGYSLKEADGTIRTVYYSADHKRGFQAVVHKMIALNKEQNFGYDQHKAHANSFIIFAGY